MPDTNNFNNMNRRNNGEGSPINNRQRRESIRSNNVSSFDLFNINVRSANKNIDNIFKYAKSKLSSYNKYRINSENNTNNKILDLNKRFNEQIESQSINSTNRIINNIVNKYTNMYSKLSSMNKSYISNISKDINSLNLNQTQRNDNITNNELSTNRSSVNVAINKALFNNSAFNNVIINNAKFNNTDNINDYTSASPNNSLVNNIIDNNNESINTNDNNDNSEIMSQNNKLINQLNSLIKDALNIASKNIKSNQQLYEQVARNSNIIQTTNGNKRQSVNKYIRNYQEDVYNKYGSGSFSLDEINKSLESSVKNGLTGSDATTKAINDLVMNRLVPAFDTQSEQYTNLMVNMSENSAKQFNNQILALKETKAGNRLLESGVINSLTNELAPLLTNIDFNTGGYDNLTKETQALIDSLVENGKYSPSEAYSKVLNTYINPRKNLYGAINSGNVEQMMSAMSAINGDSILETANRLNDTLYSKISNASNDFQASATMSTLGIDATTMTVGGAKKLSKASNINTTSKILTELQKASEDNKKNNKKNIDATNSTTSKIENIIDNSVNSITKYLTDIPGQLLAINTSLGILTATNVISAFKNFGNTGSIFKNLLPMFSSTVSSTNAVAGTVASSSKLLLSTATKLTAVGGIIVGAGTMLNQGLKGYRDAKQNNENTRGKISAFVGSTLGGNSKGGKPKNVAKNAGRGAILGASIGTLFGGPVGTLVGGAIGAGIGGRLGLIGGKNISKGLNLLLGNGWNYSKKNANRYATGLNYVPHDNYHAILHEGEAVVNKSQADKLRKLGIRPDIKASLKSNSKKESSVSTSDIITAINNLCSSIVSALETNTSVDTDILKIIKNGIINNNGKGIDISKYINYDSDIISLG